MTTCQTSIVTIVTKYYPPYSGITGELVHELATYLIQKQGMRVKIVHTNANYGKPILDKTTHEEIHIVQGASKESHLLKRLFHSLTEGYRLIQKAKAINEGEPIIILSDPPLIVLFAILLLRKKNWFYWTMDLYPDAYAAAKIVSPKNWIYKVLSWFIYRHAPAHLIALGANQAAFIQKKYKKTIPTTILPPYLNQNHSILDPKTPEWYDPQKIHFCYCGNLGRGHSATFLIQLIKALDPNKFSFILSAYGVQAGQVNTAVQDYKVVKIIPHLSITDLSYVDIHTASLLPEWTHISVPSKVMTSISTGATVLFYGDTQSDSWQAIRQSSWNITHEQDLNKSIEQFLATLSVNSLQSKKKQTVADFQRLISQKNDAFEKIAVTIKLQIQVKYSRATQPIIVKNKVEKLVEYK